MSLADRMANEAQYGHVIENQCQSCARRTGPYTCEAFPGPKQTIPFAILMGVYDHTHPYAIDGQDDQGLTYAPKDG